MFTKSAEGRIERAPGTPPPGPCRELVAKETFHEAFWRCHHKLRDVASDTLPMPGYFRRAPSTSVSLLPPLQRTHSPLTRMRLQCRAGAAATDALIDLKTTPEALVLHRFLTYLALTIFIEQRLDVIVLEVGLGGRLDATNIVPAPVATAVTTLDYDHVELLGDTLDLIAREKAGIFRAGVPAVTCAQAPEAAAALRESADQARRSLRASHLTTVPPSAAAERAAERARAVLCVLSSV